MWGTFAIDNEVDRDAATRADLARTKTAHEECRQARRGRDDLVDLHNLGYCIMVEFESLWFQELR